MSGRGVRLAAATQLVAVALHLPRQLVDHQVQRVQHLGRGVTRPQGHALEVERGLGHVLVGHSGVRLLEDLDLEAGQVRDLTLDLGHTTLHVGADLVGDRDVSTLDLDLHHRLPSVVYPWRFRCYAGGRRMSMGFRQNGVSMPAHAVWTWSPGVLIGAALLAAAYVRRWMHVRRTSSRPQAEAPVWRLACFTASVLLALAALISPVDSLADQLFCMHMVQHMLLLDAVPVLAILGFTKVILRPVTRAVREVEHRAGMLAHPAF